MDAHARRLARMTAGAGVRARMGAVLAALVFSGLILFGPGTADAPAEPMGASPVVSRAAGWYGVPYVYGGSSRSGIDCSAFTRAVYAGFGVYLPDDPALQFGYGRPVYGPPRAGDLVFFDEGGYGISHVGIATGRGTVIHASNWWGYVTETRLEYLYGYAGARRLI